MSTIKTADELTNLLERLTAVCPVTSSYEGLDDGCLFCDGFPFWTSTERAASHEPDCVWVEARLALGHDIAPHEIKRPKLIPVVKVSAHNPLIGY